VHDTYGYLAGTDIARAADINEMFDRDDIDAIICSRGGYGAMRLLPLLDYQCIRANPKPFIGYSDITSLHLAFWKEAQLATFYGPMVSIDINDHMHPLVEQTMWQLLTEPSFTGELMYDRASNKAHAMLPGIAEGVLVGGCMTLVEALLGTPWQLDCTGRILFLEDVDEEWHDIDRMLAHLALAGIFRNAAAIIMGEMVNVQNPDESKPSLHLAELYRDYLSGLDKPVLVDFPSGHGQDITTLPLGCAVRLDASAASIRLLEAATI
jgi:muramoyltetrapeptide carboxypeptidase